MSAPLLVYLVLIPSSFLTSMVSAVLGMAGGVSLIGVMTTVLPIEVVVPIHAVAQLFSNSARSLLFVKQVRWRFFLVYVGPLAAGTYFAARLWSGSKLDWLRPVIGAFILSFLAYRRWSPKFENPPLWVYVPLGAVIGFVGIFVGATGPLLAPFFFRSDFAKEEIIATKAMCQTAAHVLKVPAFLSLGFDFTAYWDVLACVVGAGFVGTVAGKRLLERMSERVFVAVFEAVLFLIGVYLLASGVLLG